MDIQARRHVLKSGPAEVRASSEGTTEGESTRGDIPPVVSEVRGIPPTKFLIMVASMCVFNAFWISFQSSWADLLRAALAYP